MMMMGMGLVVELMMHRVSIAIGAASITVGRASATIAAVAAVVGIVVVSVNHHPAITPTAATERPRQQLASACTDLPT